MKVCHIYGISRSGIHSITNWVMGNCGITHLHRKLSYEEVDSMLFKYRENLCFTYENKDLTTTKFREGLNVLIIRDPFNHFASVIKRPRYVVPITEETKRMKMYDDALDCAKRKNTSIVNLIDLWTQYAREACGITNYIPSKVIIKYNDWFSDIQYRNQIAEQMGCKNLDKSLQIVPTGGGASSFDDTKFDGKANQMNVLERWKVYEKENWFWDLFNSEIADLSDNLFELKGMK